MVNVLIRVIRVLPIVAIVTAISAVAYGLLVAASTREKARKVLLTMLSAVSGALTVVFALITLYALFENNPWVLEVADVSAALFAIIFIIVRIVAWRTRRRAEAQEGKR